MEDTEQQITEYKNLLIQKGIKSTHQRLEVLRALGSSNIPLTAEDIYLQIREKCKNLSLSTVYRILEKLTDCGVLAKLGLMEGGKSLFQLSSGLHRHNLICIKCKRIMPIDECPLKVYENTLEKSTGFKISGHRLEVYGICPKCKK